MEKNPCYSSGFASLRHVVVDSGGILVCDERTLREEPGFKLSRHQHLLKIGRGVFDVEFNVNGSWKGPIQKSVQIACHTGYLFLGDACYGFKNQDDWLNFLAKTKNLEGLPGYLGTGGDGEFSVTLSATWVGDL
jgi:hypothetical protein